MMLNKMIRTYQHAKLAAVKKFSDQDYDILTEPLMLDNGYIQMKIEELKQEYVKLDHQIEPLLQQSDEYSKQKCAVLLDQKEDLHLYMAFFASNSLNSVEFAIQLVSGRKTDFSLCLEALYHYKQQKMALACERLEQYFSIHPEPLEHFLISKIYGRFLMEKNDLDKAAGFLRMAAEKRPDDREVHQWLVELYQGLGNKRQASLHQTVIELLEGDRYR